MTKSNFSGACDPTDPERHKDLINHMLWVFKNFYHFFILNEVE